ncbi:hypothetical protein GQX73_g8299 [Xylaria multiplex]|uniref:Terpene synthase n=1 Tax=Xylaria multiplex TaxID=323545 RepID=A0A7C8MI75_9PEZI|nr:hypothetical protein GQX73_g8299 [Xylaria multiplex]
MQTTTEIPPPTGSSGPDNARSTLQPGAPEPEGEHELRRSVRIPDLFSSIMAARPAVNPNYFKVKAEGDRWIAKIMNLDDKTSAKNTRADFCLLCSMWVPNADEEALRTTLDWSYWIFFFDDQFDEGHLRNDPIAAREEIDRTIAIMEEGAVLYTPEQNPLRYVFQTCWQRLVKYASPEHQRRYKEQHKRYFDQVVTQVERSTRGDALSGDIDAYVDMRFQKGFFNIPLCKNACGYHQTSYLWSMMLYHIGKTWQVTIFGAGHRFRGMSTQQSVDKVGALINNCYKRWYTALAELPPYGKEIDSQVVTVMWILHMKLFPTYGRSSE